MYVYICEYIISFFRLGLDPKTFMEIINSSTGRCWASEIYNPVPGLVPTAPANNDYKGGFSTDLITKVNIVEICLKFYNLIKFHKLLNVYFKGFGISLWCCNCIKYANSIRRNGSSNVSYIKITWFRKQGFFCCL